ncbi:MAG TPA: hypothetical protein VL860_07985 [Planctomycetota bacterium]|nr:hypothetical protein [Planctomycetota bacterium]
MDAPRSRWWSRLAAATAVSALAPLAASLAITALAPAPLQPPDPARAAEALAEYTHKHTVAVELLLLPIAALLAALFCTGVADAHGKVGGWHAFARRLCLAFAVTAGLALGVLCWDYDHPSLSSTACWAIYQRYTLLLAAQNLAVAGIQFGVERAVLALRSLRHLPVEMLMQPSGLGITIALALYSFCLATTFISRPWIAGRTPSEAMVDEHVSRYLAAIETQAGPATAQAPGFRKESRIKVESALRAALNAESIALTADINPLVVASSIWWYHDDGPPTRRVDLRTGAITYNQWIGSDARITLPDFCRTAEPSGPAHFLSTELSGESTAPTADTQSLLAGIELKTGVVGTLAGYSGWRIGPPGWGLGLSKDDAAPLAVFFALSALAFATLAQFAAQKLASH